MPNHCANLLTFSGSAQAIETIRRLVINPATDLAADDDRRGTPFVDFGIAVPMPVALNVTKTSSAFSDIQKAFAAVELEAARRLPLVDTTLLASFASMSNTPEGRDLVMKAAAMGFWPSLYDALTREASRLLAYEWVPGRLAEKGRSADVPGIIDYVIVDDAEGFALQKTYISNRLQYGHETWYEWSVANWGSKWGAYDCRIEEEVVGTNVTLKLKFDTAWSPPEPWFAVLLEKLTESFGAAFHEVVSISGYYHDEGGGFWGTYTDTGLESYECDGGPAHRECQLACYGSVQEDDEDADEEDTSESSKSDSETSEVSPLPVIVAM